MEYADLQRTIYQNKLAKIFNVTDVGKEIVLMTEEFGELCDSCIRDSTEDITDAVGDLMIYCLGLSAMFEWNSDEVVNEVPETFAAVSKCLPYIGREVGFLAKAYKKSNQKPVSEIDNRDEFRLRLGNIMGYCKAAFVAHRADELSVLEGIVSANTNRTHEGHIK